MLKKMSSKQINLKCRVIIKKLKKYLQNIILMYRYTAFIHIISLILLCARYGYLKKYSKFSWCAKLDQDIKLYHSSKISYYVIDVNLRYSKSIPQLFSYQWKLVMILQKKIKNQQKTWQHLLQFLPHIFIKLIIRNNQNHVIYCRKKIRKHIPV